MNTFDQWWRAEVGDDPYTQHLDGMKPHFQRAFDAGAGAAGKAIDDLVKARALAREAVEAEARFKRDRACHTTTATPVVADTRMAKAIVAGQEMDAAIAKLLALLTEK